MNKLVYFAAGALLLLVAGLASATEVSASVSVSVTPGASYSHYCSYSYYSGYYACYPYAQSFGPYCDPFDPFYSSYCYVSYNYPTSYVYPTYVVNPGTVVYANAQQPQGRTCSDGTSSGMCSTDYPKYCFDGQLIDKATMCGCPAGQVQDPNNRNRCVAQTCSDGTALNSCSSTKPSYCTANGNLVERPQQCGCPTGTRLEGGVCAPLNSICFVSSVSPSTIREGQSAVVSVSYSDVQTARGYVNCGNGQVASLACSGGVSGTCVATCSYSTQSTPTVQAYVNGQLCSSSANVNVAPAAATSGDALVRVTDCTTGRALSGASVQVGSGQAITDANGEARVPALGSGTQSALVSRSGYVVGSATTVVTNGRTSMLPVCLQADPAQVCDVNVELAGTVTTSNVQNGVQIRVTNNLQRQNPVTLSYSSVVPVNGPLSLSLSPGESRVVTIYPIVGTGFSGSSLASVNVRGSGYCSDSLDIPLNLQGGLTMSPLSRSATVSAGGKACVDLLLQNKAQRSTVQLAASGTGLTFEFDNDDFVMEQGESRVARVCANVPDGATGGRTVIVTATSSASNNAQASFEISLNPFMYSDVLGCFNVNGSNSQFFPIQLTNRGQSESFVARLTPSTSFTPSLTQPNLFNFVNQSSRTVYVQVDPSSMNEMNSRATLTVFTKDSNVKVFEQELCFQKNGVFDANTFVTPARLVVEKGSTGHAFIHVQNTGNVADVFEVSAVPPFAAVNLVSTRMALNPGEEKVFELTVSPSSTVPSATYLVPLAVYSLRNAAVRTQVASLNLVVDVKAPIDALPLRLVLASQPEVTFNQTNSVATIKVQVTNYDDEARVVIPSLRGLPGDWNYTVDPAQATIPPLTSKEFTFNVKTKDMTSQDYNATVVLTDEIGREAVSEVVLPAKSSNWVTGFFVLGSSAQLFGVLILILVAIGLYLLYKAWSTREKLRQREFAL